MLAALVEADAVDVDAVVGAAVDQQRVAVVDHAGVAVHAAAVVGVADVLGVRHLARVAQARRRPHVADRRTEGGRLLADQPAVGVAPRWPLAPSRRVTLTGPGSSLDLIRSPSALEMPRVGMVIVGSVAGHAEGAAAQGVGDDHADGPGVLRVLGLLVKAQRPRSSSAMLPATAAALSSGEQPSVVVPAGSRATGSAGSATSVPRTTSPVTPAWVSPADRRTRRAAGRSSAMSAGELISDLRVGAGVCVVQKPSCAWR